MTQLIMVVMERRGLKTNDNVCATQVQQFTEFTAALWLQMKDVSLNSLGDMSASRTGESKPARARQHECTFADLEVN